MALTTIDLHGKILQPVTNTPAVGTVTFKILDELRDNADNTVYSPQEFNVTLVNGEFTITLPVTDDPNVTPLNWSYWAYVDTDVWNSGVFFMPLPTSLGPVAEFADILPLVNASGSCTPDGSACAPIGIVGVVALLEAEVDALASAVEDAVADVAALGVQVAQIQIDLDSAEVTIGALVGTVNTITPIVLANQAAIAQLQIDLDAAEALIVILQGQVATNTANIATNTTNITTIQGQITALQTAVATLQGQITNIDAAWITTGTLAYQRLGGNIAELDTVFFNRPTLVAPGTAADVWQFRYNGVRVTYANEFACFRVRGIPDNQVPARVMSNLARDNTPLATFQVSLSDATTHLFQVLADGSILAPGSLSMLPSARVAVVYTGLMGDAATISDGSSTGAPYATTTTLHAAMNRVYLDGAIANNGGVSIPGGTVLLTVTAAHRPTAWVQCNERTSTTLSARVTIRPDGTLRLDQALAAGATVSLDGFNYRKS